MKTKGPYPTWLSCRVALAALLVSVACLTASGPALADGSPGGGTGSSRADPGRPEDPDLTAGVSAIKAQEFATAIPLLERAVAQDGQNADAYNWLAYAIRKNGDPARSIPLYQKALAIDPKHRGAHEYIGEAYLALDDLPRAREHLKRLDKLCFFPCSEYTDLKKAVEAYEKSGGKVKPTAGR
jgi:tetratricopeptide (TPR) repeat protein